MKTALDCPDWKLKNINSGKFLKIQHKQNTILNGANGRQPKTCPNYTNAITYMNKVGC